MIAADSNVLIDWINQVDDPITRRFDADLRRHLLRIPPVVVTEVASNRQMSESEADLLLSLPILKLQPGFWHRAGRLRAALLKQGRKAKLGDALVAQACIDADVPLLTRDRDFQAFTPYGLKLVEA